MQEYKYVLYDVENGGIGVVTLNRPEKLNAFNLEMYEEICGALAAAEEDPAVRVIVVKGAGRAFCSGRDFAYSAALQDEDSPSAWRRQYKLFSRWTIANSKMTIALVHGYALGGGGSLAIGCDMTIAAAGTKFGYPETRHGIASKTMAWPWVLGPKAAKEIVVTGRMIAVEEGLQFGLANRIVPLNDLESEGMDLARKVAAMPYGVPELAKRYVNSAMPDMMRVTFQDRLYDVDTAHWDAAGVEPSPWMLSANVATAAALRARINLTPGK